MTEFDGTYMYKVTLDRRMLEDDDGKTESEQWVYDGPNLTPISVDDDDFGARHFAEDLLEDMEIPDGVNRFILSFRIDGSQDYWGEYDEWVVDDSVEFIPLKCGI